MDNLWIIPPPSPANNPSPPHSCSKRHSNSYVLWITSIERSESIDRKHWTKVWRMCATLERRSRASRRFAKEGGKKGLQTNAKAPGDEISLRPR